MSGWGSIYNNTRIALQMHSAKLADLQEQTASGARINRASDDPPDAHRILRLHAQSGMLTTYTKNLDDVTRTLEVGYGIVTEISSDLQMVIQKLEQAASGTYGPDSRKIIGEEINSILERLVSLVNTSSLGRYLFSGAKTDTASYVAESDGERITAVRYEGGQENLPVPIAPGVELPGLIVGDRVFRARDRQEPQFLGETGAVPGRGTASVLGSLDLQITHDQTTVVNDPDGSGLVLTNDPNQPDTLLGEYDLIVDVTGKTIQFAGGPAVAFQGTETALAVPNADGDVVHVDVTGLNGALVAPATVTIRSTGLMSIDEGVPPVALDDFTDDNVQLLDAGGRVLYIDVTGLRRTGVEAVHVPGTADLFATLIRARDVLINRAGYDNDTQVELTGHALDDVREVYAVITQAMTSVGGRVQALDALRTSLEGIQASADDQAAQLQDADVIQLALDLARTQTLYQATLATSAKLLSLSLLDFI
jgi:flagellar hook-associated protein 3 FlgL